MQVKTKTTTRVAKLAASFASANASIESLWDAPAGSINQWCFGYGERFLEYVFEGQNKPLYNEVFTSSAYWRWFTHQYNMLNHQFATTMHDQLQQHHWGNETATRVLKQAYRAFIAKSFTEEAMLISYEVFINQYIATL